MFLLWGISSFFNEKSLVPLIPTQRLHLPHCSTIIKIVAIYRDWKEFTLKILLLKQYKPQESFKVEGEWGRFMDAIVDSEDM